MKYHYFCAYKYWTETKEGSGDGVIIREKPIENWDDIKDLREAIKKQWIDLVLTDVIIQNFILLRTEED